MTCIEDARVDPKNFATLIKVIEIITLVVKVPWTMRLLFFQTPYNQVINNCLVPILLSRWHTILHIYGRTIPTPAKALSVNKYVGKMNCKILQIKPMPKTPTPFFRPLSYLCQ